MLRYAKSWLLFVHDSSRLKAILVFICSGERAGNASAAVFTTLAVLVAVLGIFGTHHQKLQMRNTTWLMSWALFFLAYTCFLGGESAMNCEQQDDTDDKDAEDAVSSSCAVLLL